MKIVHNPERQNQYNKHCSNSSPFVGKMWSIRSDENNTQVKIAENREQMLLCMHKAQQIYDWRIEQVEDMRVSFWYGCFEIQSVENFVGMNVGQSDGRMDGRATYWLKGYFFYFLMFK